jgi:acetylornithine aminotransferase
LPLNEIDLVEAELIKGDVACVIIEPIQGVGGLDREPPSFQALEKKVCKANDVVLILDEVQSGFGKKREVLCINFMTSNLILYAWQRNG